VDVVLWLWRNVEGGRDLEGPRPWGLDCEVLGAVLCEAVTVFVGPESTMGKGLET
jgi:hypothetical protein